MLFSYLTLVHFISTELLFHSNHVTFLNITSSSLIFSLTGVPGLGAAHAWISIPFCCFYTTALSGNGVIITESSFHEPMYHFLSVYRPGLAYVNTGHYTGHNLAQCKTDPFPHLCCPDLLHSTLYCHGVLSAPSNGF